MVFISILKCILASRFSQYPKYFCTFQSKHHNSSHLHLYHIHPVQCLPSLPVTSYPYSPTISTILSLSPLLPLPCSSPFVSLKARSSLLAMLNQFLSLSTWILPDAFDCSLPHTLYRHVGVKSIRPFFLSIP